MTNVHMITKTWRYLMIIPSILLFLLLWSFAIFGGGLLDMPIDAWVFLIVVSAISGGMIYGTVTSKIVTSPEGIENISFGIQVMATWDKIEKIEFAPDGLVNLHFKEPIYTNQLARTLRFLYPYDKTILLSPYAGDLATSKLLKDIAQYVPNSNIPAFVAQQKYSTKKFQEAGIIGLYYLGWFVAWFLFAMGVQKKVEEYVATLGLPNADSFLNFIGLSLVVGLFVNAIRLLRQYNVEIIGLNEYGISHKARTHYLGPFVIIVMSFLIGSCIWTVLPMFLKSEFVVWVMILQGIVSLPISSRIERSLFRDNL